MKNISKNLVVLCGIGLALAACSKGKKAGDAMNEYIGNWKVTSSQGQVYYMTLNPDGTGQSTRDGGEIGKWHFHDVYIEIEWLPKVLKLYFDSGQTRPLAQNHPVAENKSGPATAIKVDSIPGGSENSAP